jgi:hypothetical protein
MHRKKEMHRLIFPAHGALGPLEEVLFFAVVAIFIIMMAVSWMRSQQPTPDEPENGTTNPADPSIPDENRFELK